MSSNGQLDSHWLPGRGADPMESIRRAMNHIWFDLVAKSIEPVGRQLIEERALLEHDRGRLAVQQARNRDRREELARMIALAGEVERGQLGIDEAEAKLSELNGELAAREGAVAKLRRELLAAEQRLERALGRR